MARQPLTTQGVEVVSTTEPGAMTGPYTITRDLTVTGNAFKPADRALVHYEAACSALARAASVDEVQEIRGQAEALKAYARIASNKQMEADAIEIRMRAVRRLGELMAKQKEAVGLNKGGGDQKSNHRGSKNPSDPPTLAEAGIDKNLAKQARKLASISADMFEAGVTEMREGIANAVDKASLKMANPSPPRSAEQPESEPEDAEPIDPEPEGLTGEVIEPEPAFPPSLRRYPGIKTFAEAFGAMTGELRSVMRGMPQPHRKALIEAVLKVIEEEVALAEDEDRERKKERKKRR